MTFEEFFAAVERYCTLTGASVTSWRRTVEHNRKVGGVESSPHLFGVAVDVVYDRPTAEELRRSWAQRLGLRCITEGDHDHLQPLDWKAG